MKINVLGVIVMSLLLVGCASVHTEILIEASPEEVWEVLSDTKTHQEWNPVLKPLDGEFQEGAKLKYQMIEPGKDPVEVSAKVIKVEPNKELNQYGGIWGIMTFDHHWYLEPTEGGTKVIQHEEYRGVYVPFWDYSWVEPAYAKANEALKNKIETK